MNKFSTFVAKNIAVEVSEKIWIIITNGKQQLKKYSLKCIISCCILKKKIYLKYLGNKDNFIFRCFEKVKTVTNVKITNVELEI